MKISMYNECKDVTNKRLKEKDLDDAARQYIRNRDRTCQYPLRPDDYHAGSLQVSHFYGRTYRSVRWTPENLDLLCGRHHQFLEGRKNAEYYDWKLSQLGEKRFKELRIKCYQHLKFGGLSEEEKRNIYSQLTVTDLPHELA